VVLAEDSVVLRDGMVELLGVRGCEVVATAGTAPELLAGVAEHRPDVAVVDIRMPPTHTDEGMRAAALALSSAEWAPLCLATLVRSSAAQK
jgi:DNA-binding NarL/FixJ family response regulator